MTYAEAYKMFKLAEKTMEQGAQDLMEWASYTMSKAEELHKGGFITAKDRATAEKTAADAQKYAYALRGVSYL